MWPLAVPPLPVARTDRAASGSDSNVYEDFFPLGAISSELCPLHNSPADTLTSIPGEAPAVIPASYGQRPIVVERAIRSDGRTAISLRGGGQ